MASMLVLYIFDFHEKLVVVCCCDVTELLLLLMQLQLCLIGEHLQLFQTQVLIMDTVSS